MRIFHRVIPDKNQLYGKKIGPLGPFIKISIYLPKKRRKESTGIRKPTRLSPQSSGAWPFPPTPRNKRTAPTRPITPSACFPDLSASPPIAMPILPSSQMNSLATSSRSKHCSRILGSSVVYSIECSRSYLTGEINLVIPKGTLLE